MTEGEKREVRAGSLRVTTISGLVGALGLGLGFGAKKL